MLWGLFKIAQTNAWHAGCYCDVSRWRKQTLGMLDAVVTFQDSAEQTLGMLDAVVTFQDGTGLVELTDNLFSRFVC